uniref:UPAR/Ly6 domain-containing protein n=1 Tax=Arion vulgaris TaxID=1028688 RepID=A0A0B6Y8B9_9EUPU
MEMYILMLVFANLIGTGLCLECYVCQNQPDNKDKCVKTSVQCREDQDTCMTFIEWKAPTFWTPRSEKIQFVHKSCNSSSYCADQQRAAGLRCMRDWYKDWYCYECCQGDRCNFYVTLGVSGLLPSVTILAVSLAVVLTSWRR